jgi:hypothetical protein
MPVEMRWALSKVMYVCIQQLTNVDISEPVESDEYNHNQAGCLDGP